MTVFDSMHWNTWKTLRIEKPLEKVTTLELLAISCKLITAVHLHKCKKLAILMDSHVHVKDMAAEAIKFIDNVEPPSRLHLLQGLGQSLR